MMLPRRCRDMRRSEFTAPVNRFQISFLHFAPLLQGVGQNIAGRANCSIIDQRVDPAGLRSHALHIPAVCLLVRDIGHIRGSRAAIAPYFFTYSLHIAFPVERIDNDALLREFP